MNPIITFFVIMIVVSVVISILYYSSINNNNTTPPPQSKNTSKSSSNYEPEYTKKKTVDTSYNTTYETPNTYVIVDVQTTGLDYYTDSILEITAEKYVDGIKKGNFHSFCKYTKTIPEDAFNINHIFSSDVNNAPSIRTVLNELLYYIKDYPILTYNTEFEMGFLQYNYVTKLNKRINNDVIDGLKLCRDNLPELHDHKLSTVQKHLSVIKEIKHSYNNCKVINHMYQYCLKREESRNKYGVPFSGDPCELNDLEKEYLSEFVKLCSYNKVKKSELSIRKADKYLIVERVGRPLLRFKLNGKLHYFLIDVPYNKFKDEHHTEIECTAGSSSEVGMTRVFSTAPDQMKEFKEYIFTSKNRVWSTQ